MLCDSLLFAEMSGEPGDYFYGVILRVFISHCFT